MLSASVCVSVHVDKEGWDQFSPLCGLMPSQFTDNRGRLQLGSITSSSLLISTYLK